MSIAPHFTSRIVQLMVVVFVAVLGWPAVSSAQVVGVPVNIDSFGNPFLPAGGFTRTVTRLPLPGTSTTPQGTFTQADSLGSMEMFGTGNGTSGIALSYTPMSGGAVDLTSQGSNGQLFVQFARIAGDRGLTMWIDVTDANGGKSRFASTGVGNVFAFNAAFPFTGFKGSADFRAISKVAFTFVYPATNTGGGWLQVDVNKLWATPISGAQPRPPSPAVTAPPTALGVAGAVVDFTVKFTNNEGAAPVTYGPPSAIGLRARDVDVTGTAFGGATPNVAVTGGPSTYKVSVSGMTKSGGIRVHVPEGVVDDGWLQLNTASADDPTVDFTFAIPPRFQSAANASFTVGNTGAFVADANGGLPVPVPTPKLSVISGSLPAGLTFTGNGNGTGSITGKPAAGTGGVVPLTLRATNFAGTVTQDLTLTIYEAPSITSADSVIFQTGTRGSVTVTTGHDYPTTTRLSIPDGSLPAGVAFKDNGDGTASLAGTPEAGSGGTYAFDITARNSIAPAAVQRFTLTVFEPPSITTASTSTFTAGSPGTFEVKTGHDYPAPTSLSIPANQLPPGVEFRDNGDGTATIAGIPAAGSGGAYDFEITARNSVDPDAVQSFTLTVERDALEPTATPTATPTVAPTDTSGSATTTTPAGTTAPPSGPAVGASIVSDVSQTKPTWSTSGDTAGTTFALTLSRAAKVTFTFTRKAAGRKRKGRCVAPTRRNRHRRACKRTIRAGTLSLDGATGLNRVPFRGILDGGRRLRPGRYTLLITATDAATGKTSKLQRLRFTIVR